MRHTDRVKATLVLANAGEIENMKISASGAGWNVIKTPVPAISLLAFIDVPWNQANEPHKLIIELLDADGRLVVPPNVEEGVRVELDFECGSPPGLIAGTPVRQLFAVSLGHGLPLEPGQQYEFHMTIDGEHMDNWLSTFTVRA